MRHGDGQAGREAGPGDGDKPARVVEQAGGHRDQPARLAGHPAIVLADEPTGNLDQATGQEIMALLRALNAEHGVTLVVITHDMTIAATAPRRIELRDGRVVADGGHADVAPAGASKGATLAVPTAPASDQQEGRSRS